MKSREMFKKSGEELQLYLHFRKRGGKVDNKKGKGSYKRHPKHKNDMRGDRNAA